MNKENLQQVFSNYISKFEYINNAQNNEGYKWEIAQHFQDEFDLEAADFAEMLYSILRGTSNFIDSANQQPLYGLVCLAREEPEAVRTMFRDLFEPDGDDLAIRQEKIREFIASCQLLLDKYYPGSWRYANDQRSVMTYLFLHDPDHNYLYKYTQATEFADCVGFYEDWGSGTGFKLDVYYRMCDELVQAIKGNSELVQTNASRFEGTSMKMYPDPEFHILAFDIIYCCTVYDLFRGISYKKPDAQAKKLVLERKEKAAALYAEVKDAAERVELLKQGKEYFVPLFHSGAKVSHKTYGAGIISNRDGDYVEVSFGEHIGIKKFILLSAIGNGFLSMDDPLFLEKREQYKSVLLRGPQIESALEQARKVFAPYADYLDA